MTRALVNSSENLAEVKRVLDYATEPEHWYDPTAWGARAAPGAKPEYTCTLDTYRCVYTITVGALGLYRHLTISVPSNDLPNHLAAFQIAAWFGFTGAQVSEGAIVGPGDDWFFAGVEVPAADGSAIVCGVLAQLLMRTAVDSTTSETNVEAP